MQPQAAQAKDKTPSRYKRYCVTKTRFIRVCMGTQRLCFRRYKIECSVNKNDLLNEFFSYAKKFLLFGNTNMAAV